MKQRPHTPLPRAPATRPAAQRTRRRARRGGRPDALPHALSRPGFCPSPERGATKPRPLALGARRWRSSGGSSRNGRRGRCAAQARQAVGGPPPRGRLRQRRPPGRLGAGPTCSWVHLPRPHPHSCPARVQLVWQGLSTGPVSPFSRVDPAVFTGANVHGPFLENSSQPRLCSSIGNHSTTQQPRRPSVTRSAGCTFLPSSRRL